MGKIKRGGSFEEFTERAKKHLEKRQEEKSKCHQNNRALQFAKHAVMTRDFLGNAEDEEQEWEQIEDLAGFYTHRLSDHEIRDFHEYVGLFMERKPAAGYTMPGYAFERFDHPHGAPYWNN